MDFLKSGWNSVLGTNADTSQPSVAETVCLEYAIH
jgi:hypothetical protein